MITVEFYGRARSAAGTKQTTIEAATVAEAVTVLGTSLGNDLADVLEYCAIWVNDEPTSDSDRVLAPGDSIAVLPPVAGG